MKLAWVQKADAIETDLWLSKDGKLVVFHDADTRRYDGKQKKVTDMTWEETQQVDVGSWKSAQFKGEKMPTLESLLATVPEGKRAVLELKQGPEIVPEFARVLIASKRGPDSLTVISFNYEALKASKKTFPNIPHYYLLGYKKKGPNPELSDLIKQCKEAKFDGLNLQYDWPITKEFTAKVKAAGLKLLVWTVDDPAIAKKMMDAGVDAITTNKPQFLREQLEAAK